MDNAGMFYSWCYFCVGHMKSIEISYSVCGNNLEEGSFVPSLIGRAHEKAGGKNLAKIYFTSYLKYNKVGFSLTNDLGKSVLLPLKTLETKLIKMLPFLDHTF